MTGLVRYGIAFVLFLLPGISLLAQDRQNTAPARVLELTSTPPGASAYLDSEYLGTTPLTIAVPETTGHPPVLTLIGGAAGGWFSPVVTDTLADGRSSQSADTLRLHYDLPLAARIASEPSGAEVVSGDSTLGTTPLFASLPRSVGTLRVRKPGYREETVLIDPATFNYRVALAPGDSALTVSPLAGVSGQSNTGLYIAGGLTVAAGTAAALLKQTADETYDEYQVSGDPATLDRVHRFDVASAISLAVAQIGLGYIIIVLLSR